MYSMYYVVCIALLLFDYNLQRATVRACHMPCCPLLFVTLLYCYCFFERNKWRWRLSLIFWKVGNPLGAISKPNITQVPACGSEKTQHTATTRAIDYSMALQATTTENYNKAQKTPSLAVPCVDNS